MAKIKVGELKEIKKIICKDIEIHEFNGLEIEIKQHLPILEKINLVSSAYASAINTDDGLHILNGIALDIAFRNLIIKTYTNINTPADEIQAYNLITEIGLYDFIYDKLPEMEKCELQQTLNNYIQEKQDEYNQKNTIQFIVKDLLNGLINKMPDEEGMKKLIEDAKNTMDGFSPENVKFVQEFLKKTGEVNAG